MKKFLFVVIVSGLMSNGCGNSGSNSQGGTQAPATSSAHIDISRKKEVHLQTLDIKDGQSGSVTCGNDENGKAVITIKNPDKDSGFSLKFTLPSSDFKTGIVDFNSDAGSKADIVANGQSLFGSQSCTVGIAVNDVKSMSGTFDCMRTRDEGEVGDGHVYQQLSYVGSFTCVKQ